MCVEWAHLYVSYSKLSEVFCHGVSTKDVSSDRLFRLGVFVNCWSVNLLQIRWKPLPPTSLFIARPVIRRHTVTPSLHKPMHKQNLLDLAIISVNWGNLLERKEAGRCCCCPCRTACWSGSVKYSWPEPEVSPFWAEQCREFRVRSEARRVL
jgi:hypothetical protein